MLSCCAVLLFVGGVVAAPTPAPPRTYEQVVASAVQMYNQQKKPEFAFRLLEAEPVGGWDPSAKTTQALKFSIKETTCPSSEKIDASKCDYKPEGVDRDCSGFYSTEQSPPRIVVQCEDMDQEIERVTRGRWKRFWKKTGRFIKNHGWTIVGGIARFTG
ncbi:hypothetical protein lerEdw1_005984 [Lerista edwardsae]|nr:hypothetical protein lerEdw1_005984 [Lerista edwardsae]